MNCQRCKCNDGATLEGGELLCPRCLELYRKEEAEAAGHWLCVLFWVAALTTIAAVVYHTYPTVAHGRYMAVTAP